MRDAQHDVNWETFCVLAAILDARFNKYRIPRENMLMRFSKVSRDGVFTKPPHAKVRSECNAEALLFLILSITIHP